MSIVAASRTRRSIRLGVAGLFAASGVLHLVRPSAYDDFLPDWTPNAVALNVAAGAVELVCAYGLVTRRRWAGPVSAVTLVAVWPSNLQFALDATAHGGPGSPRSLIAWVRMPLQIPMIWAVLAPIRMPADTASG